MGSRGPWCLRSLAPSGYPSCLPIPGVEGGGGLIFVYARLNLRIREVLVSYTRSSIFVYARFNFRIREVQPSYTRGSTFVYARFNLRIREVQSSDTKICMLNNKNLCQITKLKHVP